MSREDDGKSALEAEENAENSPPPSERGGLPRSFGRLTLLKQLAKGGMGEVYLAATGEIEGAERPCVVKIIRREHERDKSFLARFLDEARIQAQLQHPGVAQVLEASTSADGKPFVIVEYVEGRNLSEVRHRATSLGVRFAWPEAVAVAIALGDALAHVHERTDAEGRPLDIVHRDLSPQNVMVGYAGDVKLIDFGTARGENRRSHTVSGVVFAKPGYVAPEVANNNPGGAPADLYAFGVMLWELLSGRRFLTGDASVHLAAVGAGKLNPTPIALLVDAPEELDRLIAKLTAPAIVDRYASARQATADLVSVLKKAPSLANGERSVRGRIAHLMQRLYPAEPARYRAEFARLVAEAKRMQVKPPLLPAPSPSPLGVEAAEGLLSGTRYRLVREIGRGGMGVVHEAVHLDLGRTVALKILARERADSPKWMAKFRSEARAIALLNHDNLVKLHDFGVTSDGRPYYAMELLQGETLAAYLERERGMDFREVLRLGIQACRALEVAHSAGVVHRDIKPANLFLAEDGTLKLLDFGVATLAYTGHTPSQFDGSNPLSLVGTLDYLAPEQAAGKRVDHRADVYSLGVVLYELLTGSLPFPSDGTVAILDAKLRQDPQSPRKRAPNRGLPIMLDRTIMRSLARDPDQRFQSAAELRQALAMAFLEPERLRNRRRRVAHGAVAVALLGATVLAGIGILQPQTRANVEAAVRSLANQLEALSGQSVVAIVEEAAAEASKKRLLGSGVISAGAAQPEKPFQPDVEEGSQPNLEEGFEPELDEATAVVEADIDLDELAEADAEAGASEASEIGEAIRAARRRIELGATIAGFNQLRKLMQQYPDKARVLEAWAHAAVHMKAWGDAYRAAVNWARVEPSAQSRLFLAKMERATGRGDHVQTLHRLVEDYPEDEAIRLLWERYSGSRKLARK